MSDSNKPIFYRSSGLIYGTYLPSDNDPTQGILITDEGLFPASSTKRVLKLLTKYPEPKTIENKHYFICFVLGLSEAPHYQLYLIGIVGENKFPQIYPENNTFLTQGIIIERSPEIVIVRVQKNILPHRTKQEIEDSINYLKIKNCPGKIRTSQFWSFCSRLQNGFLQCQSAELLANAKLAKSYLKIPSTLLTPQIK